MGVGRAMSSEIMTVTVVLAGPDAVGMAGKIETGDGTSLESQIGAVTSGAMGPAVIAVEALVVLPTVADLARVSTCGNERYVGRGSCMAGGLLGKGTTFDNERTDGKTSRVMLREVG